MLFFPQMPTRSIILCTLICTIRRLPLLLKGMLCFFFWWNRYCTALLKTVPVPSSLSPVRPIPPNMLQQTKDISSGFKKYRALSTGDWIVSLIKFVVLPWARIAVNPSPPLVERLLSLRVLVRRSFNDFRLILKQNPIRRRNQSTRMTQRNWRQPSVSFVLFCIYKSSTLKPLYIPEYNRRNESSRCLLLLRTLKRWTVTYSVLSMIHHHRSNLVKRPSTKRFIRPSRLSFMYFVLWSSIRPTKKCLWTGSTRCLPTPSRLPSTRLWMYISLQQWWVH